MINRKNRILLLCYGKSRLYAQSRCNAVEVSCNRLGRCDRNFSKVATARGFARGLLALAKCNARCDRKP